LLVFNFSGRGLISKKIVKTKGGYKGKKQKITKSERNLIHNHAHHDDPSEDNLNKYRADYKNRNWITTQNPSFLRLKRTTTNKEKKGDTLYTIYTFTKLDGGKGRERERERGRERGMDSSVNSCFLLRPNEIASVLLSVKEFVSPRVDLKPLLYKSQS